MFSRIKNTRLFFLRIALAGWFFAILLLSLLPGRAFPSVDIDNFDKIVHILEYFILAVLIIVTMYYTDVFERRKIYLFTLISGVLYGILLELVQRFVPGRTMSLFDALFNVAGVILGIIFGKLVVCRK
ncbi:MAG: VanZ family protein [Candidatus Omnitrophota bacterium]